MPNSQDFYDAQINRLRSEIANRGIVTIVGAGATMAATRAHRIANWIGLLEDGIQYCVNHVPGTEESWANRQRTSVSNGDVDEIVSVAALVEKKLKKTQEGLFYAWLRDTVGSLRIVDDTLPHILSALPTRLLTTNYDLLLEEASGVRPITWKNLHLVEDFLRYRQDGVFHIHGQWEEPDQVVLGVNYESLVRDEKKQERIHGLLRDHRFLFVGVGAGIADPHFRALMDWSNRIYGDSEHRHFYLTRRAHLERTGDNSSFSPHLVALPFGDDYEELPAFLETLIPSGTVVSVSASVPTQEYQIVIQGDVPKANNIDKGRLEAMLQTLTQDESLRLVRVESGSLRLTVNSTEESKVKLNTLSKEGVLRARLEESVIEEVREGSSLSEEILVKFQSPSSDLLNWPQTLKSGEWLERPEVDCLVERISNEESSATILLGGPGTGKSALLSRLGAKCTGKDFTVIACKADYLPHDLKSLDELQHLWSLPLGVVDSVRYLCRSSRTVLLIDQLDALADVLDVGSQRLNILLELINRLSDYANLHIVASSRRFEFSHDVRLSTIEASEVLLGLPEWDRVAEVLAQHGVDAKEWPEEFREILRVPQHLKVMLGHFCESNNPKPFKSYQMMLEALWDKTVLASNNSSDFVDKIASDMAKAESLWVPKARYDGFRDELNRLIAADIFKTSHAGLQFGFSHQTLFSFARARAFAKGSCSLSDYVLGGQGSLFIRPTLWNALFYVREANDVEYSQEFVRLWNDCNLRPHVRYLLIDFLGQIIEPLECEVAAIYDYLKHNQLTPRILSSLAGHEKWFHRLRPILPALMRLPHEESWPVTRLLRAALPFASTEVLRLMETHWLSQPERDAAIWRVLESPEETWPDVSHQMILRILDRTDVAQFHVTLLISDVAKLSPLASMQLARRQLDKELSRALEEVPVPYKPSGEALTDKDELVERIAHRNLKPLEALLEQDRDWHDLPELAEAHPAEFLSQLWPWLVRILNLITRDERPHTATYSGCWSLATALRHDEELSHIYVKSHAFDVAIKKYATENTSSFLELVYGSASDDVMLVQRLLARGLCQIASIQPGECLSFLLADERRLVLGDSQNMHKDSTELITAMTPHLSTEERDALEKYIVDFKIYKDRDDDIASARFRTRKHNREHRLRLLNAIPEECLSQTTKSLLLSERVALKGYRDWDVHSSGMVLVDTPMSSDQMKVAKDRDILGLFGELEDSTGWDHPRHSMQGGTIQASRAFAEFAKSEPERAIAIIDLLQPEIHEIPVGHAIIALAEMQYPSEEFLNLLVKLWERGFNSESFREDAARSIRTTMKVMSVLPDRIYTLLETWLAEPWRRPIDAAENKPSSDDESAHSGAVLWAMDGWEQIPHGTYRVLDALTCECLRRRPALTEKWMSLLEQHLDRQDRAEVWRTMTHWLDNLKFCDQPRATAFLQKLFERYPGVLCSRNGALLLANARHWLNGDSIAPWIEALRDSEWTLGPQVYGEIEFLRWGTLESSNRPIYLDYTRDLDSSEKIKGIQRGLAYAAAYLWAKPEYRTHATEVMVSLMPSKDEGVQSALLGVFRVTNHLEDDEETTRLLDGMCANHVFTHDRGKTLLLDRLVDFVVRKRQLVARVVDCFIEAASTDLADFSTAFAGTAPQLADISLTLQRYDDSQEDGLRLFERLLELNAYGAQDALNELDQIPRNVSVFHKRKRRKHGARKKRSFE